MARLVAALLAVLLLLAGARMERNGAPDIERLVSGLDVEIDSRPVLVVLFQPEDCGLYSGLVRLWNELHEEGSVQAMGLGIRFGRHDRESYRSWAGTHPDFPVRFDLGDAAERVMSALGQTHTPIAILLDSEGRVRMVVPPTKDAEDERMLGAAVREQAEGLGV